MDPGRTLVVSIVGVDGCGKSSAFRGALSVLAQQVDVVGIGDVVLAGAPGVPLHERDDLRLARANALVTRSAKRSRRAWLYRQLKSIDLIGRSRMRDQVVGREAPTVLLTDGDPLVNTISWAVARLYRQDLMGRDERVVDALRYLAGDRRIPLSELPYYLRTAWQLAALNRLHLARFRSPDVVIQLQIDGATAMRRIGQRGRPLQPHETEAFLSELADGYDRVCGLIATRCGVPVIQVSAERHSRDEIVRVVSETVLRRVVRPSVPGEDPQLAAIEVVATTMSGSLRDQHKIGHIGPGLRALTPRPVHVHEADSHLEARARAQEIVRRGGRIIVSAGGAGTFNAVLEGCHLDGAVPADLRLVFLRKGSADLIGKMLRIPDDLPDALAAISDGIGRDRHVTADVLSVESRDVRGRPELRHLVGFAGLGVFGEVPRFTETRAVKLYKGILSTLLGDYGPFFVGLALATAWWLTGCLLGRIPAMILEFDEEAVGPAVWSTVILVNGDLGPHFRLGRGMSFSSGTFRVVALRYRGLHQAFTQLAAVASGRVLDAPERYGCLVREVKTLVARPADRSWPIDTSSPGMVNVDGLQMLAHGAVRFSVAGRVELVAGPARAGDGAGSHGTH